MYGPETDSDGSRRPYIGYAEMLGGIPSFHHVAFDHIQVEDNSLDVGYGPAEFADTVAELESSANPRIQLHQDAASLLLNNLAETTDNPAIAMLLRRLPLMLAVDFDDHTRRHRPALTLSHEELDLLTPYADASQIPELQAPAKTQLATVTHLPVQYGGNGHVEGSLALTTEA